MITVLYPPGAFGSTVEYCLRKFSLELESVQAQIHQDGSMHTFIKEFHPTTIDQINQSAQWTIATPVYPGNDGLDPVTTVQHIQRNLPTNQKGILIHCDTPQQVARNFLFAYHKIPDFVQRVLKNKHRDWNPAYESVDDMQTYEKREALSFLLDSTDNYLQVSPQAHDSWLRVTPDNVLYNFKNTVITMLKHCTLTLDPEHSIDDFYQAWFEKQQYIIAEFQTIQKILHSIDTDPCEWNTLSIMGEAIAQHGLRAQGLEMACHDLNCFPTTTQELKRKLIAKETHNEYQNF